MKSRIHFMGNQFAICKLIAHEMDTGFFAKVGSTDPGEELDADTLRKLKALIQSRPELLSELLKETG